MKSQTSEEVACTIGAELALLCWLYKEQVSNPISIGLISSIQQILLQLKTHQRVRHIVQTKTLSAASGWLAHELVFHQSSRRKAEAFDWLLKRGILNIPRPPVKELETLYYLEKCGGVSYHDNVENVIQFLYTTYSTPIEYHDSATLYNLTHFVFYATDFGRLPAHYLIPQECEQLLYNLTPLLDLCLRQGHIDLLGEIILAQLCLTNPRDRAANLNWMMLANIQGQNGSFLDKSPNSYLTFVANYHPVIITALIALQYTV